MTEPSIQAPRTKIRLAITVAVLCVLCYLLIALATDATRLIGAIARLGGSGCAAVLALSCSNYLVRFVRWHWYLSQLGHRLPLARHLLYYIGGFAFTLSPAKAGEAVRSIYLRNHGVSYAESIGVLFVERLLDVAAMVILAALILADHSSYRPLVFGMLGLVIVLLVAVGHSSLPRLIDRLSARSGPRLSKLLLATAGLLRSAARLLHPRLLALGLALGVVAWGAMGLGLQSVSASLSVPITAAAAIGIYAMAVLAGNAVVFLPGGIGGTEVVMTALLVEAGAPLSSAVIATLLCSLATLWFAVLLGVLAAAIIEMPSASRVRAVP